MLCTEFGIGEGSAGMLNVKNRFILGASGILIASYAFHERETIISICTIILLAGVIVLLLAPACTRMEKAGVSSLMAALISVFMLILTVALPLSFLIPYLTSRTMSIFKRGVPAAYTLAGEAEKVFSRLGMGFALSQRMTEVLSRAIPEAARRITAFFARSGIAAAEHTGRFCFSLVIAYYALCERMNIGKTLLLCVPLHWRTGFLHALHGCRNAVLGYVSALIRTSAFVGAATYIGLVCVGIPDALLLAVFMGLFEFLPYAGPVLASIPILLSAASLGWEKALISLCLVIGVQLIEGNIISPYFSSSSTDIHPLTVIISVFIGGSFFGFWGILFAVPAVVTMRCIAWTIKREASL